MASLSLLVWEILASAMAVVGNLYVLQLLPLGSAEDNNRERLRPMDRLLAFVAHLLAREPTRCEMSQADRWMRLLWDCGL